MKIHDLKAGIIGTGFIGPVHLEALRRLGVNRLPTLTPNRRPILTPLSHGFGW